MPTPTEISAKFTSSDLEELSINEYHRCLNSSQKSASILLYFNKDQNEYYAKQFAAPYAQELEMPIYTTLKNINIVEKWGALRATAQTPKGTEMVSVRNMDLNTNDTLHKMMFFSPKESHCAKGSDKVYWGSKNENIKLFRSDLHKKEQASVDNQRIPDKHVVFKVDKDSIPVRTVEKRKPNQNKVMGKSAFNAYMDYFAKNSKYMSEMAKKLFKTVEDAKEYYFPKPHLKNFKIRSQVRPEWAHAGAYSLTPTDQNPQVKSNLASAGKHINTTMMAQERCTKWIKLNTEAEAELDTRYEMLNHELVEKVDQRSHYTLNGNKVSLERDIYPFQNFPRYPKPTDVANTTFNAFSMLNANTPDIDAPVTVQRDMTASLLPPGLKNMKPTSKKKVESSKEIKPKSKKEESEKPKPIVKKSPKTEIRDPFGSNPLFEIPKKVAKVKPQSPTAPVLDSSIMPNHHENQNSVVRIHNMAFDSNYEEPWKDASHYECSGSGVVMENNGKKYVLTNAHVVTNRIFVDLRLANSGESINAKVIYASNQSDLALLEVNDENFQQNAVPLAFGDMLRIKQDINVVGFPMGGEELSTTTGKISRIQVDDYVQGGNRMLQVQTEAPINPGNSGGPIIFDNKIVGIAFQGISGGDGLGYIIPTPVIQHFLKDAFAPQAKQGFPNFAIDVQPLLNQDMRAFCGLKKGQSGVKISGVDYLSDAYEKLECNDVILEIDGHKVSNDFMVNLPGIGYRIEANHLFQSKHIGDTVHFKILRKKDSEKQATDSNLETLDIDVELKWMPGQTKVVGGLEFDKLPSYLIASGVVFQPVTQNYMETPTGSILRNLYIPGHGFLYDVAKIQSDQQLIIVNRIFRSEHSKGYEVYNAIVKVVNGKKIMNMKDLAEAIDSNTGPLHQIVLGSGEDIVVKNLSHSDNLQLLKKYRVRSDRSDDLQSAPNDIVQAVASEAQIGSKAVLDFLSQVPSDEQGEAEPEDSVSIEDELSEESGSEWEEEDDENSDEDYDYDDGFVVRDSAGSNVVPITFQRDQSASAARTPGERSYLDKIKELEDRFGAQAQEEESISSRMRTNRS